jgi:predicted ATPase
MMTKLSREVRHLQNKWQANTGWPQRLDSVEIANVRGWTGQRVEFKFPIVAISGENGSGKSTVLQAAASVYQNPPDRKKKMRFASDFFPDTPWEAIHGAVVKAWYRQGQTLNQTSVRKPTDRWRGNPERPQRIVSYIDLARIQPVSERTGYLKMAKPTVRETRADSFSAPMVASLSQIMGRQYTKGKMATTDAGKSRKVPVVAAAGAEFSAFHQGAGEFIVTELLQIDPAKYSLVLIDEVETSLHPRAQRRLIRELAEMCRLRELQVILTTHSPYVLSELPPEARGYIQTNRGDKEIMFGVSPEYAMTQMDDEGHPECDVYVEDDESAILLREILVKVAPEIVPRIQIIPYGAASVGQSLGQMTVQRRFPRPSVVFLDGDQSACPGCRLLPGGDAPEIVVFSALKAKQWTLLDSFIMRDFTR